jgi:PRC-barrel domain
MTNDIWSYPDTVGRLDLVGFKVEAADGEIGKVDETNLDTGYFLVDTGTWIFGKKILLPAGVINRVDRDDERVYVNRTKRDIERAPEYDEDRVGDDDYRDSIGGYYASRAERSDEPD